MVKIFNKQVPGLPTIKWANGKPTMIVLHDTANPTSTVAGERNFMSNNYRNAFYHAIVDEEGMHIFHDPSRGGAWGAGRHMHNYAIHIELLHSKTKAGFQKAYKNYVDGAKYYAKKYGIPIKFNSGRDKKGIVTHHYVTKTWGGTTHGDPDAYLAKWGVSISQLGKDLGASKGNATTVGSSSSGSTAKPKPYTKDSKYPKLGNYGPNVLKIQKSLNKHGYKVDTDSSFGPATDKSVRKFQKDKGLVVDGQAGPATQKELNKAKSSGTSKPKPKPKPSNKYNVAVDGSWGPDLTRNLQRYFGTTVDGVISGQPKNRSTQNIPSAKYGTSGSNLIRAMQRHYKCKIVDGKISNPSNLIKTMQRKYGLKIVDGHVSLPSNLVKEIQRRLNKGTL